MTFQVQVSGLLWVGVMSLVATLEKQAHIIFGLRIAKITGLLVANEGFTFIFLAELRASAAVEEITSFDKSLWMVQSGSSAEVLEGCFLVSAAVRISGCSISALVKLAEVEPGFSVVRVSHCQL